jgi:hypothetical protein
LEVADIFRGHGPAWRKANAGHVSLGQLKVMSAIESCRTAALGGHVARCEKCSHTQIAYNSCRNRHCPKCQGAAAKEWLAAREAELLPVPYYHVVFTLPAAIADIAYQNKAIIYDLLFKASAETLVTIAADPKHLGARVGVLSVLHSWGSALTHHPHVHMAEKVGVRAPQTWCLGSLYETGEYKRRCDCVAAARFAVPCVLIGLHLSRVVAALCHADGRTDAVRDRNIEEIVEALEAFEITKLHQLCG